MSKRLATLATGGLVLCLLGAWWANRCAGVPTPGRFRATVCYRWFRARYFKTSAQDGSLVSFAVLNPADPHGAPVSVDADLFGSGRMSEFVTNARDNRGKQHQLIEVASRDDGRIDLIAEYDKVPLQARAGLVNAYVVNHESCSDWVSIRTPSRSLKMVCRSPSARKTIGDAELDRIVANLHLDRERESGFLLQRLEQPFRATKN
jgi:hypothetical protein